jgi:hypothetical protein
MRVKMAKSFQRVERVTVDRDAEQLAFLERVRS